MNISTMFLLLRNSSDCCLFAFASLPHMSIGTGVVVAIALQQIDRAPNAEASAQRHNEGLKNTNSRIKESHK